MISSPLIFYERKLAHWDPVNCLQYDDFCSERVNNPFTPRVSYGDIKVILTFEPVMKSFGVTIQMKPLQQYFHMVL